VERVGLRLAAQLPSADFPWEFGVIREYLGGSRAGMLAHAMAHVAERHWMQTAARGQVPRLLPAVFVGPGENDGVGSVPLAFLKIQRGYELDADRMAAKIMAAAGYDPEALLAYIRRTQRSRPPGSVMYSALPPRERRIEALAADVESLPSRSAKRPSDDFISIRDRARNLLRPSR
jgi:predicted Zn-dependent protease